MPEPAFATLLDSQLTHCTLHNFTLYALHDSIPEMLSLEDTLNTLKMPELWKH